MAVVLKRAGDELVEAISLSVSFTAITTVGNLFFSKQQLMDRFQEIVSPCQSHSCCSGGNWMPIFGSR